MTEPTSAPRRDERSLEPTESEHVSVEDLYAGLSALDGEHSSVDSGEVRDIRTLLAEAHGRGLIESEVRHLRARDAVEAFVGSVIFASPLLVEDGIFDIATYLFEFTVAGIPVFLIANTVFVVFMTYALLEWTGRNRAETHHVFGVIPVRVIMVLVVSFVVATILMTVWGRVGDWQPPAEAIARINVIWTVGSLGAALGDILSESEAVPTETTHSDRGTRASVSNAAVPGTASEGVAPPESPSEVSDSGLVDALHAQFDELASAATSVTERDEIEQLRAETIQATLDAVFVHQIRKYTGRDIAEAFVGSIFFAIPFLVEDGVFDVADYFLSFRIGAFPVFFLVNAAFVLAMIWMLVFWAGPRDVQMTRPIFGIIPRRLVGIGLVSFLTAAMLMTMWGRVENWADPVTAIARISVVWTIASFGAALGDILPGESSGDDIYQDISDLGDFLERESGDTGGE